MRLYAHVRVCAGVCACVRYLRACVEGFVRVCACARVRCVRACVEGFVCEGFVCGGVEGCRRKL